MDQVTGMWIAPDGGGVPARIKGGPLYDAFHGISHRAWPGGRDRLLTASKADLAAAYALAVWAYRCIKVRADAVAGVPLMLVDRDGAAIPEHPLLDLLRDVNPDVMNLGDLLRATESAYNIWGVAYWLIVRNGAGGPPRAIYWLNPQTVEPLVEAGRGVVGYRQSAAGQTRDYPASDVMVFRNFNPLDDVGGLSPLAVALEEVNAELNAARYVASFFANDARPAGLLTTDQQLHDSDMEQVATWWNKLFRGVGNRWRTGIVSNGLKWFRISFPPYELALPELRAEDRRSICAVLGVPAGMAGAWEATTYATAHEQKASFYEDTVLPQLEYLAEVINWSLLALYPDLVARGARITWDIDHITALRESSNDRVQRVTALFQAGLITRSEARAELGLLTPADMEDGFMITLSQPELESQDADTNPPGEENAIKAAIDLADPHARRAAHADLKRWERFAVRRVKAGRRLRPFHSDVIPDDLHASVSESLAQAEGIEDVFVAFGEAHERVG